MAAEGSPGDDQRGYLLPPSQTAEDRGSIILAVALRGLPGHFSKATRPSGRVKLIVDASLIVSMSFQYGRSMTASKLRVVSHLAVLLVAIQPSDSPSQNSPLNAGGQTQSQVEEFSVPPFIQLFSIHST